ncbi:hemolysin III family protein [Streptomyces sp. NPDC015171]|uniref:PAQR family membrane homeostasis protein TrhA n=1 Tax=Streptomyces sp. NPDC015171 TaxID=3364945 RepID=UPI0036F8BE1A
MYAYPSPPTSGALAASADADLATGAGDLVSVIKPRLRGWLHAAAAPLVLAAGIVLIALAPAGAERIAAVVYAATAFVLFATSAVYHRGSWGLWAELALRRVDHTNIYLITAGSYTPIAVAALTGFEQAAILAWVWTGAAVGIALRLGWRTAPRALTTSLYIALGWSIIPVMGSLFAASTTAGVLIVVGGGLYTLGGIVYAAKWPDLSPRWFGFHELFHLFTIAAWTCQYIGIALLCLG